VVRTLAQGCDGVIWDVLIAAGVAVVQLVITWYAVDVSLREKRVKNAAIIGLIGALGIGLTIWGAVRNGIAQGELNDKLSKIQHNTETPPQVTVNVPSAAPPNVFVTGERLQGALGISKVEFPPSLSAKPFQVNVHLANVGQAPIDNVFFWETAIFRPIGQIESIADSNRADRSVYKELLKSGKEGVEDAKRNGHSPLHFAIDEDHWGTMTLYPTDKDVSGTLDGTTRLYFFTYAEWNHGKQQYIACRWLQPPASADYGSGSNLVLHDCGW
jgi:hypothetical protein